MRVHVDIAGRPIAAGSAYFNIGRRRVATSFVYDADYLANPVGYDIEPDLVRQSGQQSVDGLPGALSDCAPDRWGRNLIDKRRRALQRESKQRLPASTEVDYLLGVSDMTRQGNLRFSSRDGGPFLDPDHAVPKLVSLPMLLASADKVADAGDDNWAAVKALLDAGSGSLGGARPKASVLGDDGDLLIAKFPHRDDEWDVMAWEKTALDLAAAAGISTPGRRLTKVGSRSVLLLDRFDRAAAINDSAAVRIGYVSAMTLLGTRDGDERDYVDIAEAVSDHGARVNDDLAELFRRVVLSVALHNTDDHLRNHGFLRAGGGWALSPIFDVNPNPDTGKRRVTSLAGADDFADEAEALLDFAPECRLSTDAAVGIVAAVGNVVETWRDVAAHNGIAEREQKVFAETFTDALARLRGVAA